MKDQDGDAVERCREASPRRLALTDRELEILRLLATPKSPAEIASQLVLSKKTVQNHISAIYRKLDVGSRSEAIVRGMELHLIDEG
jgi:DNA-binding CsgD family transcriptional regulator